MDASGKVSPGGRRGRIVRRYFLVFAVLVGGSLVTSAVVEMVFRFQETHRSLALLHERTAELAALRIRDYVDDIAQAVQLTAQTREVVENGITANYIFDLRNLLKNVPATRNLIVVGPDGRERLRQSRIGPSRPDPSADHTADPFFTAARGGRTYFGPVTFPPDSLEPRMMVAVPIERFPGQVDGVLAAEVNVRYVLDVIREIRVGKTGYAYVVNEAGILIAHPDLHLVLQRSNVSGLSQLAGAKGGSAKGAPQIHKNFAGHRVLASSVRIPTLGWTVLVEQPLAEAFSPLYASLARTGGILLLVCVLAVGAAARLGRRVVRPIEALRQGADRLGAGELEARLAVHTGDEFEALAEDFNRMAGRLHEAYAGLEQKVADRTHALKQSVEELQALGETLRAVSASLDLERVLQTIVVHATELSRSDGGVIFEFEETGRVFRVRAWHLLPSSVIQTLVDAPPALGEGAVGRAAATGRPAQVPDVALDPTYPYKEINLRAGLRSLLAVPMLQADRVVGGIVLARRAVGGFADKEVDLLRNFANGSAIAIQNARLFRELERKNEALVLASQHKSAFLANMSHELRTPMNAILGFTELLLDGIYGELGERVLDPVQEINRNGRHLLALINDILDLTKIEAGRMDLAMGDYVVRDVLDAVLATARPLAAEKGLTLEAAVEGEIGPCYGDGKRITQVLLNLVGNAVKFTHRGRVDVRVSAADGQVHYSVADTGIGISPQDLEAIFDEFRQGDASVTKEYSGTGLGLSIARRFVEMHGGRIWAESALGAGSTFHVVVPQRAAPAEGSAA
jgi:signal transduction histidine kinase/HAMP domain-containing protein